MARVKKEPAKFNHQARFIAAARRVWRNSPERREALERSKARPGFHICSMCKTETNKKLCTVDHIIPIGKFSDWNEFYKKLNVPSDNLQVLCEECHKEKTKEETRKRAEQRKLEKAKKKACK